MSTPVREKAQKPQRLTHAFCATVHGMACGGQTEGAANRAHKRGWEGTDGEIDVPVHHIGDVVPAGRRCTERVGSGGDRREVGGVPGRQELRPVRNANHGATSARSQHAVEDAPDRSRCHLLSVPQRAFRDHDAA